MVTHDARAAAIAHRVLFLADGVIVRELGECDAHTIHTVHGRARRGVTRVALRGLAGRKLRAVLTAIAIVLGVAMISGTYILTDTIDRAFNDALHRVVRGNGRRRHGEGPGHLDRRRGAAQPAGRRVAARDRSRRRRGRARDRVGPRRAQHEDPEPRGRGGELRGRADVRLRRRHRPGAHPVQPAQHPRGALAGRRGRGRHRRGYGRRRTDYAVGRHRRDHDAAAEALVRARRRRAVRQRRQHRECELRRVHHPGRAGASRPRGAVRRDLGGRGGGRHRGRARRRDRARAAGERDGRQRDAPRLQRRSTRSTSSRSIFRYFLLTFGGDRALRRRVRHLQHVLDHRRAADARVRDAADDRRVAAAGPRLGDPRVAASSGSSRRSSASGSACSSPRGSRGSSAASASSCRPPSASSRSRTVVVALVVGVGITLLAGLFPAIRATRVPPIAAVREGATLPQVQVRIASCRGSPALVVVGALARARARDVHGRARHGRSPALDRGRRPAALPRRRDALVARRASARGHLEPDRALGCVPLHGSGLAVLPASVLAPALGACGPGSVAARLGALRRRGAAQPVHPADRLPDVASTGRDVAGSPNGPIEFPTRGAGSRRRADGRRERAQEPGPHSRDRRRADDRDRARRVHRDADERHEGVEPRGDRGADRGRLRRDVARRLHAVRRRGWRRTRRLTRARGRDERAL